MPLRPDEIDAPRPLSGRVYDDPLKALTDALRGAVRGSAAMPGDIADLAAKATPTGAPRFSLGDLTRQLLDKVEATKGTESPFEKFGELAAPNPMGKVAALGTILLPAKKLVDAGMLHPQKLIDALKMFKATKGDSNEVWRAMGVEVTKPSVLSEKLMAQAPVDTPGFNIGPKDSLFDKTNLSSRVATGDVTGLNDVLRAAPELGGLNILKSHRPESNDLGAFNPVSKTLDINYGYTARPDHMKETFGHELKHAIDEPTGFPSGSNVVAGRRAVQFGTGPLGQLNEEMQTALLWRQLLEKGQGNPELALFTGEDAMSVLNANRGMFKGMEKPSPEVMAKMLKTPAHELEANVRKIQELQSKVPRNGWEGYLHDFGEGQARRAERMVDVPLVEVLKRPYLSHFDEKGIPNDALFDTREYTTDALLKARIL